MNGWHFIRLDRKLGYGDNRIVKTGRVYKVKKDRNLEMCKYGLHASKRLIDALRYAPGPVVCRVELRGEIEHDEDKSVAYERKVLSILDATNILHEFACRCAEDALKLVKNPDPRSIAAIKAKRDWLKGKITDQELSAARPAAWSAAARSAARSAAWSAAASAAWFAARSAGWSAARSAARDKQNRVLTAMVLAAMRKNDKK